ncbi:hypothetical protein [Yoonia sp. 2307UL14-13]|uniref:hypothetical protein n=1 Tax=Yoonia sp. 2307UL14-13 TaxID=3126506 RepID=UPI0030B5282D
MPIRLGVLPAALLLAACMSDAPATRAAETVLRVDPNFPGLAYCIVNSELEIGGVRLGMSEADVIARLGTPDRIQRTPELRVDYVSTRLTYDGLLVDLHVGGVVDIYATSPRWTTPSGFAVGMSQQAVWDMFGVPLNRIASSEGDAYHQVYGCDFSELGEGLEVFIDDDLRASGVTVFSDKP